MMILGIDIAQDKFDVALYDAKQLTAPAQFPNTAAGFTKLHRWLQQYTAALVWACLEATGRYGEALATYLHAAGHSVSIVNPVRIKKYADSQLRRHKTDQVDARLIADFCRTQEPNRWTPPAAEHRALPEMVRRLGALTTEQTRERNRAQAGLTTAVVQESIAAHLEFLKTPIAQLAQQIQAHIAPYADLQADHDLLTSIKGIGDKTAAIMLGELPAVANFAPGGQVGAYAGLSPRQHTSGSSVRKRSKLTKTGHQRLKAALYFPALSAIRFNPLGRALAARLTAQGKAKMVIVGAAMRKLLHLAYGVLKTRQPFDPDYARKTTTAS